MLDFIVRKKGRKKKLKKELLNAIKKDKFVIYLQPIYSVKEKKIVSAEVLSRMIDSKGNIIAPMDYIPLAEENGLIHEIEHIVFEKACKFIQNYNLEQLGLEYLEINLSVCKGENKQLLEEYDDLMKRYDISPNQLNLEITETATITQRNILLKNMLEMSKYGINFALDDYGTGECNLNYIIEMPVSIVKFDKSMIDNYFKNNKAKILIEHSIDMIHNINLKTVAEGIETKEQFNKIIQTNVDFVQGYYFSKPLCEQEFLTYIKSNKVTI